VSALEKFKPFIERPGHLLAIDTSAFIEGEYFTDSIGGCWPAFRRRSPSG